MRVNSNHPKLVRLGGAEGSLRVVGIVRQSVSQIIASDARKGRIPGARCSISSSRRAASGKATANSSMAPRYALRRLGNRGAARKKSALVIAGALRPADFRPPYGGCAMARPGNREREPPNQDGRAVALSA